MLSRWDERDSASARCCETASWEPAAAPAPEERRRGQCPPRCQLAVGRHSPAHLCRAHVQQRCRCPNSSSRPMARHGASGTCCELQRPVALVTHQRPGSSEPASPARTQARSIHPHSPHWSTHEPQPCLCPRERSWGQTGESLEPPRPVAGMQRNAVQRCRLLDLGSETPASAGKGLVGACNARCLRIQGRVRRPTRRVASSSRAQHARTAQERGLTGKSVCRAGDVVWKGREGCGSS